MSNQPWQNEIRSRILQFESSRPHGSDERAYSIKIRVESGCFHREHSPEAYRWIDDYIRTIEPQLAYQILEHESGPEIIAFAIVGVGFAAGVTRLVTEMVNTRYDGYYVGREGGTEPILGAPLEIIVRGFRNDKVYVEELVLRVNAETAVSSDRIEAAINACARSFLGGSTTESPQTRNVVNFHGNVGNVAIDSRDFEQDASGQSVSRPFDETKDLRALAEELRRICDALWSEGLKPQNAEDFGTLNLALSAADKGNGPEAVRHLARVGKWAFDFATNVGASLVATIIGRATGLAGP